MEAENPELKKRNTPSPSASVEKRSLAARASPVAQTVKPKPKPAVTTPFARTDCGRFSMRSTISAPKVIKRTHHCTCQSPNESKSIEPCDSYQVVIFPTYLLQAVSTPVTAPKKEAKKPSSGGRSNSSLSSRETEFQNWKRRKSFDPMKAAAEGRKKEAAKKAAVSQTCQVMTQSVNLGTTAQPRR